MVQDNKHTVYTIERIFLGKVKTSELIGNIVKKHEKCCQEKPLNYEKSVDISNDL